MSKTKVKNKDITNEQDKPLIFILREELFQLKGMNHLNQDKNK